MRNGNHTIREQEYYPLCFLYFRLRLSLANSIDTLFRFEMCVLLTLTVPKYTATRRGSYMTPPPPSLSQVIEGQTKKQIIKWPEKLYFKQICFCSI